MRNAQSRLSRLERTAIDRDSIIYWDWANDPYYLSLTALKQEQIGIIMAKLRPHLRNDPNAAMGTLTLEELEELERFYIARFGTEALSNVAQP